MSAQAPTKDTHETDDQTEVEAPITGLPGKAKSSEKTVLVKVKALWTKHGVKAAQYKAIFKGALPPTIAISAYQGTAWADHYTTIGYLVGIASVLCLGIQPRAKFLEALLVQILLLCLSCALAILGLLFMIEARINSTDSNSAPPSGLTSGVPYNGSASAVSAVWLFITIYGVSAFRASFPQHTIACIMFAIIQDIACAYGPQFTTMAQATTFATNLLEAFLTGMAITTAVSLFVFPSTTRNTVFSDMHLVLTSFQGALRANITYLNSLEKTDMFAGQRTNTAGKKPERSPEADAFVKKVTGVAAIQARLAMNLTFAKRELAYGKLGADDVQQLFKLIRRVMIPIVGLSCMSDIFERTSEERGWDRSKSFAGASLADATTNLEKARIESISEWHELVRLLKGPFEDFTRVVNEGLQHVAITLELEKRGNDATSEGDVESRGQSPCPGDDNFSTYLKRHSDDFSTTKEVMLRGWCHVHDIELPSDYFEDPYAPDISIPKWLLASTNAQHRIRRQLLLVLYVQFLLFSTSQRVYDLVEYADGLKQQGKLDRKRLIVPGLKRLRKWLHSTLQKQDLDDNDFMDSNAVYVGQAYKKRKDPEHLPPANSLEKLGDSLRGISHFLASPRSLFGFRAAVATLCIALINCFEISQTFFIAQRLFWAQVMTSIAMSPTAGQSLRTFFLRISGTFMAMVLAFICYYIVDGHTAGVLVFLFIFLHIGMYIVVKHPAIAPVGVISAVTLVLIIGYELQAAKLGIAAAESNGQVYWPMYILAPLRLLTVAAGLFLAWIFTIFPYPSTEHFKLRTDLGSTLYLLANFYSIVHETVSLRLSGAEGDANIKGSPAQQLAKVRQQIYSKSNMLLSGLRSQAAFVKFDIPVGGKFPKAQYDQIIERLQNILNFTSLISIASETFTVTDAGLGDTARSQWVEKLRKSTAETTFTSQSTTSLLALLSASMASGQALPPYLKTPEPYGLSQSLDNIDADLLSVRHIAEPEYASFAVIQIGLQGLTDELKALLEHCKELLGELDFSYHVVGTSQVSRMDSNETLTYARTRPDHGGGGDGRRKGE